MREVIVSLAGGALHHRAQLFDSGLLRYEEGQWSHILKEMQHGKEIKDAPKEVPGSPGEQPAKRKPGRPPKE